MDDTAIIERIDSDLEELMERFFASSHKDVDTMRAAHTARDFAALERLGHTARGTGYGYGFRGMGDIGLALENAAKAGDEAQCLVLIEGMARYLATVRVEFVR
ncbi:MAG: Hpt domain-containing protein [Pseudodesulfovibrio sp.]|uniref:Hpt domain protein n=1 Tax=Pseudodesulfovibrio aespoeensis (strain ATCC 700646 / DSM 10631 / Aspo-2) TaxID=643562 RepID=E6VRL0_PSEA9|nr:MULTISPECIES: Hpt domain-containing protein [Pseudodesulfovibrio]MBU4191865.1 Hpt domain-containing protein [Pseudomonadota bacterium]ADU63047.1 Hpt domain protein [Pseudodesulfovibrio aespoeensis Aspo-2]MBU4244548.1 Hpt domain-containing protein [Pseudomonadota bacterium]MBU4377910.1 Hpt domain-containing protein [Pseudomonadota bacterium]MBU4475848.1 Hpt domain-containing protein [Pseudomonadota bacterium]